MQVLQQSTEDEETCNNRKFPPLVLQISTVLSESISQLNSSQQELTDFQHKSALLFQHNQQLIDRLTETLNGINSSLYLKDVSTQIDHKEVRHASTNCDISPISVTVPDKIDDNNNNNNDKNKSPIESINSVKLDSDNNNNNSDRIEPMETIAAVSTTTIIDNKSTENVDSSYSITDMLSYLSRHKLDFIKFLQCNRDNIEQISGGYSDLIRNFNESPVAVTNGDQKVAPVTQVAVVKKHKSSRSDESHKSRRYRTKSKSEAGGRPGVIITTDNLEDASLKSSLYDDLDFHGPSADRADVKCQDTVPVVISHDDITKLGGEKRLNVIGAQSKMNLLKSRTDGSTKSKKIESWKTEMDTLEKRHESHYPGSVDEHHEFSTKKDREKQETVKPFETVFTTRMKDRLNKQKNQVKQQSTDAQEIRQDSLLKNSPIQPTSLAVVKYDLSTPNDPSFQLDYTKSLQVQRHGSDHHVSLGTTPKPSKSNNSPPVTVESPEVSLSSPKKNCHSSPEKSKHKHKHSSKKKSKKLSKDLEDGEII